MSSVRWPSASHRASVVSGFRARGLWGRGTGKKAPLCVIAPIIIIAGFSFGLPETTWMADAAGIETPCVAVRSGTGKNDSTG